ncbi:hypothetical protein AbraIFM66951_003175 [Aspergillus brasiliensis]|uniref:Uncharacterized protein n=2 Tax=Aspergillus brasiliensis TaxID=319629 RepID=A0A1L9USP1_ASPBC|nr:hypothetical protein ASPBRDRAFT_27747 [Aspergillus brasiliensis CBS 101740]GKZ18434.1 hypothetical protein AbraCBS73388_001357 [Aspergillus brasiliensis]GKZ50183.1 hypothetical protein AbraIFM66951_003175 [Aspergillus brasiliensis]
MYHHPRGRHLLTDSDSEFSESDYSMIETTPRRKVTTRRRSISRHRWSPEHISNTYLSPVIHDHLPQRSASTGARRRPDRERERNNQPVAVIVDVHNKYDAKADAKTDAKSDAKNDARTKSSTKNRKQEHKQQNYIDPYESEDETRLRDHRRARTRPSSVSREASPLPHGRDFELMLDTRFLERNDARQDLELLRHQQEIARLERELARHRETSQHRQQQLQPQPPPPPPAPEHEHRPHHHHHELRLLREEDLYEDEISERLRRLERFEKKQRMEEEQREAEHRYQLLKFEEAQRQAAEQEELKQKLRQRKLEELQRKIDEDEERERIKKELRDEEARRILAEQDRARKEAAMKQAAIDEWKLNEERRMIAEREERKRRDAEFKERLRLEFGYDEEQLEKIIKKEKEPEKEKEKEKPKEKPEKTKEPEKEKEKEKEPEPQRTTWIKVHHKHLLPETLIAYRLPWDWDELDSNYIIIKQWISEDFQEELFAHSRRLREGKLVTQTSSTLTELKVNDRKKDKMYLVRKKTPGARAWVLT